MRPAHENVATVLVEPRALPELELRLTGRDLWLWPVHSAPICVDGERTAFQIRRRLLMQHRGAWDGAAGWTPAWISFGPSWRHGQEPLPWAAHQALWDTLTEYAEHVRFHRRLGGVRPLAVPAE